MSFDLERQSGPAKGEADIVEIFSATLRPYRSLSQNGFIILMILFGGTCFLMGFFYFMVGAWPVFVFLGLDVLLVYVAFRVNYHAAKAFEEVIVRRDELIVRRVSARGRIQELRFNPFWAKLQISKDEDDIVTKILLTARGERTDIGRFLNPHDKTSFAQAFGAALAEAKGG
ncbi:MAG: DUF2244 domain-containing protein [Pseudomonadota bacterium]